MSQSDRMIGVRELKAHASAVLREVCETGVDYVISVRGRPIARIEPLLLEGFPLGLDGMGSSRGTLSGLPRLDWDDFAAAKSLWQPGLLDDE